MTSGSDYLLIVEDDPDIRRLLHTTLEFMGYRVITAQNGRDALDVIEKERPTIIVADIMMPQLDGFGLVHRLRIAPETRSIPVVFITATYVTPEDKEFALSIGATQFIQKPVDLDVFLKTVKELMQQKPQVSKEPLDEFAFYEGYRQRLQSKLDEKIKQITREEHLLGTRSDSEDQDLHASIRHATRERDELRLLLEQIHNQIEKLNKSP